MHELAFTVNTKAAYYKIGAIFKTIKLFLTNSSACTDHEDRPDLCVAHYCQLKPANDTLLAFARLLIITITGKRGRCDEQ